MPAIITSEQQLAAGVGAELRRNHHHNPGAEGATLPLDVISGGTLLRRTVAEGTLPASGSAYFELTASSTAAATARTKPTERAACSAGELWAGRVVGYNPIAATRSVQLLLRFWSVPPGASTGLVLYTGVYALTIPASSAWSMELGAQAPIGGLSVGLELARNAGAGAALGDRLLFDQLQLEQLAEPGLLGGYFDGDRADTGEAVYSWAGTQYASASVLSAPARPSTSPALVLALETARPARTTSADVLGTAGSYVSLQPSGLRRGTHRLLYDVADGDTQAELDSEHAEQLLAAGGTFTLDYPERPSMAMRFCIIGDVVRRLADDRRRWLVDFDYLELPA